MKKKITPKIEDDIDEFIDVTAKVFYDKLYKYFGRDQKRIMIFRDPEAGVIIFEKIRTKNIELNYLKQPNNKNYKIFKKNHYQQIDNINE